MDKLEKEMKPVRQPKKITFDYQLASEYGINAAIVFARIEFLQRYTKRSDGFAWRTYEKLSDDTTLSPTQIRRAIEDLVKANLIETKVVKVGSGKAVAKHFRIKQSSEETALMKQQDETDKLLALPIEAQTYTLRLYQRILANDPKFDRRAKGWEKWAFDIEKIHRLDGRDWKEIEQVIDWAQANSFWKSNILSGAKLRKQFVRLVLQMKAEREKEMANMIL